MQLHRKERELKGIVTNKISTCICICTIMHEGSKMPPQGTIGLYPRQPGYVHSCPFQILIFMSTFCLILRLSLYMQVYDYTSTCGAAGTRLVYDDPQSHKTVRKEGVKVVNQETYI